MEQFLVRLTCALLGYCCGVIAMHWCYLAEIKALRAAAQEQENIKLFLIRSVSDLQKQLQAERDLRQASEYALARTEEVDTEHGQVEAEERSGE